MSPIGHQPITNQSPISLLFGHQPPIGHHSVTNRSPTGHQSQPSATNRLPIGQQSVTNRHQSVTNRSSTATNQSPQGEQPANDGVRLLANSPIPTIIPGTVTSKTHRGGHIIGTGHDGAFGIPCSPSRRFQRNVRSRTHY